jgi:hypothetical protein
MSGEDAPRSCLENLIVPEIKQTNKPFFMADMTVSHPAPATQVLRHDPIVGPRRRQPAMIGDVAVCTKKTFSHVTVVQAAETNKQTTANQKYQRAERWRLNRWTCTGSGV